MVFLCVIADDFRNEPWVCHVVDVTVDDLGHCGFWVEGRQMIVPDVLVVGKVGAGVGASGS
jgi:hypothetical protein